jgi:hypothetical protein
LGVFSVDLQPWPQILDPPVSITFSWSDAEASATQGQNLMVVEDGVVYDNQMGADDDGYAGTEIGRGNITVHKAK